MIPRSVAYSKPLAAVTPRKHWYFVTNPALAHELRHIGADRKEFDMNMTALGTATTEERRHSRFPLWGQFSYRYDQDESGLGRWCSVGHDGACIEVGRYLRPGRHLLLSSNDEDISCRVVWCRPTHESKRFVVGLSIFEDTSRESASLLSLFERRAS